MTTTRRLSQGRRRGASLAALIALGALSAACGDDRTEPTPTTGSGAQVGIGTGTGSGGDGGDGGASTGGGSGDGGSGASTSDGGAGPGVGGGGTGGGEGPGAGSGGGAPICIPADGPLGSLAVESLAAGSCGSPGGTAVDVAAFDAIPGYFDRMVTVGGSRVAGGAESFSGPIWLGLDGASPDAESFFPGGTALAVQGDEVAILGDALSVQRFGSNREPVGDAVVVGEVAGGRQGLATHGDGYLVAWADGADVVARRLDASLAPTEDAQTVEGSAFSASTGTLVTRGGGASSAIVYAGETAGDWRLGLVLAGAEYGAPVDVACGNEPIRVVDVEALDDGWLVLTRNSERSTAYLIRVDAQGVAVPPAVELAGVDMAYGMRRSGDAIGVVAELTTGQPGLRTFDADSLAPLGGWVCLAGPAAGDWPIAIDTDGDGFAVLSANEADGLRMTRTDSTGEGP